MSVTIVWLMRFEVCVNDILECRHFEENNVSHGLHVAACIVTKCKSDALGTRSRSRYHGDLCL